MCKWTCCVSPESLMLDINNQSTAARGNGSGMVVELHLDKASLNPLVSYGSLLVLVFNPSFVFFRVPLFCCNLSFIYQETHLYISGQLMFIIFISNCGSSLCQCFDITNNTHQPGGIWWDYILHLVGFRCYLF